MTVYEFVYEGTRVVQFCSSRATFLQGLAPTCSKTSAWKFIKILKTLICQFRCGVGGRWPIRCRTGHPSPDVTRPKISETVLNLFLPEENPLLEMLSGPYLLTALQYNPSVFDPTNNPQRTVICLTIIPLPKVCLLHILISFFIKPLNNGTRYERD